MRPTTLSELKQLARQSYDGLWSAAQSMDRDVKLYCHWTGGHYGNILTIIISPLMRMVRYMSQRTICLN